jgi:hypothetical protein
MYVDTIYRLFKELCQVPEAVKEKTCSEESTTANDRRCTVGALIVPVIIKTS